MVKSSFLKIKSCFWGIKHSTSVWVLTQKTHIFSKIQSKFAIFCIFSAFYHKKCWSKYTTRNCSLSYFPCQTNLKRSNSLATQIVLIFGCQQKPSIVYRLLIWDNQPQINTGMDREPSIFVKDSHMKLHLFIFLSFFLSFFLVQYFYLHKSVKH